jgi:hypothetical protein
MMFHFSAVLRVSYFEYETNATFATLHYKEIDRNCIHSITARKSESLKFYTGPQFLFLYSVVYHPAPSKEEYQTESHQNIRIQSLYARKIVRINIHEV